MQSDLIKTLQDNLRSLELSKQESTKRFEAGERKAPRSFFEGLRPWHSQETLLARNMVAHEAAEGSKSLRDVVAQHVEQLKAQTDEKVTRSKFCFL